MFSAKPVADRLEGLQLNVRLEHAPLELVNAIAVLLVQLPRHLSHRLRRPYLTPLIEGLVAAPPMVDEPFIGAQRWVVSRIAEKQISRELWVLADRTTEELAQPQTL